MTDPLAETAQVALIRQAAAVLRQPMPPGQYLRDLFDGVADWLDTAGADLWAHGPLCCEDGCDECDDSLWMPHVRRALAVAQRVVLPPGKEEDSG